MQPRKSPGGVRTGRPGQVEQIAELSVRICVSVSSPSRSRATHLVGMNMVELSQKANT